MQSTARASMDLCIAYGTLSERHSCRAACRCGQFRSSPAMRRLRRQKNMRTWLRTTFETPSLAWICERIIAPFLSRFLYETI